MRRIATIITVFFLLAYTVAAISAAVYEPEAPSPPPDEPIDAPTDAPTDVPTDRPDESLPPTEPTQPAESTEETFVPRLSAPDYDDPHYYSADNIFYAADYGMPNCTCYAWGRAYELSGEFPSLSPYDACTWYDYNRDNGIYNYGDTPQEGAIACWAYADGGSGHVAVVEDVTDGVITFSNSAYQGAEFYTDTAPADDPSAGREGWIFKGYIYAV